MENWRVCAHIKSPCCFCLTQVQYCSMPVCDLLACLTRYLAFAYYRSGAPTCDRRTPLSVDKLSKARGSGRLEGKRGAGLIASRTEERLID